MGGCYVTAKSRTVIRTVGGLSGRFKRICGIYKIFGSDWSNCCSFSDESMVEFFNHDNFGLPISKNNGFLVGKKWLSVTVSMWKEDIENGLLFKRELYDDGRFPHWWLDSIFGEK